MQAVLDIMEWVPHFHSSTTMDTWKQLQSIRLMYLKLPSILPAPESSHAIYAAIEEAKKCKENGEEKTIVFGLTGTGYFDMVAYEKFHDGKMDDSIPSDEELKKYADMLPKVD